MYYIQTARAPQIRSQRLTYAEVAVRHGRLRVFEDRSLALSPMVALAGVGWYDGVFHTIIARSALRARNVMISKGWCAPAVFSIPITRSKTLHRAGPKSSTPFPPLQEPVSGSYIFPVRAGFADPK